MNAQLARFNEVASRMNNKKVAPIKHKDLRLSQLAQYLFGTEKHKPASALAARAMHKTQKPFGLRSSERLIHYSVVIAAAAGGLLGADCT